MKPHLENNRAYWDALVADHAASPFYDVEGFRRGRCTLAPLDVEEVGDVAGRSLLHLQCHFGLDTLSWARRGAKVTGADFSPKAIALARSLAGELGIPAEFVCCDVCDLPDRLAGQFDLVYTSRGVLAWLPDIERWAKTIARLLQPQGRFYIHEFHPMAGIFDDTAETPVVQRAYFHSDEPELWEYEGGSYATSVSAHRRHHEWVHTLGDVISSLAGAGLRIEFLHEFPWCSYRSHPFLTQSGDGLWRYEAKPQSIPLMFSLRAVNE